MEQGDGERAGLRAMLAVAVVVALCASWVLVLRSAGVDFYQFWAAGRAVREGRTSNVYAPAERERLGRELAELGQAQAERQPRLAVGARERRVLATYASPLLYAVFGWAASGNYETDYRIFQGASIAVFLAALVTFCRLLGYSAGGTLAAMLLFLVGFEPFTSDVRVGNVNRLQLGWLALFLAVRTFRGRTGGAWSDVAAGAVLAAGLAFKPNLVYVAVLLLGWAAIQGRLRELARLVLGLLGGAVVTLAATALGGAPPGAWLDWLASLRAMPPDLVPIDKGNFAIVRLIEDWTGAAVALPSLALSLALAVGALWRGARRGRTASTAAPTALEDVLLVATGCAIYLLSAPLVWVHYALLLAPALLVAFRPHVTPRPGWLGSLRHAPPALAVLGLATLEPLLRTSVTAAAVGFGLGTLVLFGLMLWELRSASSGLPSTTR